MEEEGGEHTRGSVATAGRLLSHGVRNPQLFSSDTTGLGGSTACGAGKGEGRCSS